MDRERPPPHSHDYPFPLRVPRHPANEPPPTCGDDFAGQIRTFVDVPAHADGIYACMPGGSTWEQIASLPDLVHTHATTVTERTGSAATITAGSSNTATADCVGGEIAIAGGCVGSTSLVAVYQDERTTATQWQCGGHNFDAVDRTITARVICLVSPL